ncbi:class GN sortase [Litorilituus lipolyticus]|uniref:Class GN sortase n=1 Tax=Litorilituus lipolyticus TaxID=2491017 RepID=A0A502KPE2_9GAMM|nr:class GN sortase [Litorilituus lipolyticus]TPH12139.1 class GN sortase [Litorilituus lipolyticus]
MLVHKFKPRRHIKASLLTCFALGLIVHSAWLPCKAWLSQQLINYSWHQSQGTAKQITPWPWADTHPVAKMVIARLNKELIILQGVDPTTLAFSAGAMHQYSRLALNKPFVIAGHKDSHFSFLQDLQMKDIISLTDKEGKNQLYQVEHMEIIDSEEQALKIIEQDPNLVLITCYPFNPLESGGSLRYVITAKLIS